MEAFNVVIWGIGKIYNRLVNIIHYFEKINQIKIVALVTNELLKYKTLDGYPILSKSELKTLKFDYLIIASEVYFKEIVDDAEHNIGIERCKILPFWILDIPYFDFEKYIKLKNSNLSIISNNCWGGLICQTLGLECLSPFKNVSFSDEDYIKLLKNLKYYLSINPVWLGEMSLDKNRNKEVPILKLDDISIKCNHELNADIAISNWIRRKNKFNWKNIFVEMYTCSKDIENEFILLNHYEKKVCFVPFESSKENSIKLNIMTGQKNFWETVNDNAGIGKNALAYRLIDLLLMNNFYRLI